MTKQDNPEISNQESARIAREMYSSIRNRLLANPYFTRAAGEALIDGLEGGADLREFRTVRYKTPDKATIRVSSLTEPTTDGLRISQAFGDIDTMDGTYSLRAAEVEVFYNEVHEGNCQAWGGLRGEPKRGLILHTEEVGGVQHLDTNTPKAVELCKNLLRGVLG